MLLEDVGKVHAKFQNMGSLELQLTRCTLSNRGIMTRRLSSSTRSHTEDSIFLRPDEDPVWLDEPTKTDKLVDGPPQNDILPKCKDSIPVEQSPQGEEVFMRKVYALVVEIHCWVALFAISQVTVSHSTTFEFF